MSDVVSVIFLVVGLLVLLFNGPVARFFWTAASRLFPLGMSESTYRVLTVIIGAIWIAIGLGGLVSEGFT